jgi:putative MATE family efflux protein
MRIPSSSLLLACCIKCSDSFAPIRPECRLLPKAPSTPTPSLQLLLLESKQPTPRILSLDADLSLFSSNRNNVNALGATRSSSSNSHRFNWLTPTLAICIPAWISMMADPLLSLMDTAFVGRVGSIELAALGACTSIFHLAFNAFRATTTATTSLVASAQTTAEKQQVTQLSLCFGVVMGLLVLVGLQAAGPWALAKMGIPTTSLLFSPAHDYLTTRLWAAPAVLFLVVAEGAFRGYGNTRVSLMASLVASGINLILDPLLMFRFGWGVKGAAAATAISQFGAASVFAYHLWSKQMLPSKTRTAHVNQFKVIRTILGANLAMMAKQGSLLLGWAYATACATRLGTPHVAAHQVALSFWLVFALWLDGAAVAAQVLMGQHLKVQQKVRSLTQYMFKVATVQGLASTALVMLLGKVVPTLFTKDPAIRYHLHELMPHLGFQQILISWTLVMEALSAGSNQYSWLAGGTLVSTVLAVWQIHEAKTVEAIWSRGIVTLFAGRCVTALIGTARANHWWRRQDDEDEAP